MMSLGHSLSQWDFETVPLVPGIFTPLDSPLGLLSVVRKGWARGGERDTYSFLGALLGPPASQLIWECQTWERFAYIRSTWPLDSPLTSEIHMPSLKAVALEEVTQRRVKRAHSSIVVITTSLNKKNCPLTGQGISKLQCKHATERKWMNYCYTVNAIIMLSKKASLRKTHGVRFLWFYPCEDQTGKTEQYTV